MGETLAFAKRRTIVYRWVVQIAQFESSKHEKVDRQRRNSVVLVKVIQIYLGRHIVPKARLELQTQLKVDGMVQL